MEAPVCPHADPAEKDLLASETTLKTELGRMTFGQI